MQTEQLSIVSSMGALDRVPGVLALVFPTTLALRETLLVRAVPLDRQLAFGIADEAAAAGVTSAPLRAAFRFELRDDLVLVRLIFLSLTFLASLGSSFRQSERFSRAGKVGSKLKSSIFGSSFFVGRGTTFLCLRRGECGRSSVFPLAI